MAKKTASDQILDQLEQMRVQGALNTEEKTQRYLKGINNGYSPHFALIYALQETRS